MTAVTDGPMMVLQIDGGGGAECRVPPMGESILEGPRKGVADVRGITNEIEQFE